MFEPGCAQCYLPRNYTMPLINGVSDTSIADSGCAELYNPTVSIDTCVMWGTGPAQHAPSSAGRAVVELRAAGTKTVVIDPRYTPDAARADVWLPVRPGTDVAMMLGWTRYIIDKKLYNEEFCSKWTNLPFLVDPSDPAGALLRASKVFADATAENEGYVYYDEKPAR
ncbi:MAG: molybdopterin-dependent oxidoreductase [Eggerthellaceae bacterium]